MKKNPIDLSQYVQSQEIEEILVSQKEFVSLETVLHNFFLQSIDEGEREAIAFLYSNQKSNKYLFCTLDQLAIKCLGILGLRFHGISIEELLKKLHIKAEFSSPYKQRYSKELFDRMLIEGFKESHLHLRQEIILT